MGNYCKNETQPGTLPEVPEGVNFIHQSWALLKKHQQLTFLPQQDENQIVQQLHSLPHQKNAVKVFAAGPASARSVILKQDAYLYVGEVEGGRMHGSGAVALPNSKLFIGSFKNGRIEGAGEFHFTTTSSKPARLTGEWGSSLRGSLAIGEAAALPFSVSKATLFGAEECKYIQYANFDEYVGETAQGLAHGEGKYTYRNGQRGREFPVYEGRFYKGLREGKGVMRYSAAMELQIKWAAGRPDGNGFLLINGTRHSVLYRAGQRLERLVSEFE